MYYEHYTEVNLFDICDDVFHEKETYRNDVWSKECMNRILQLGSGISGGKERIYSFFTRYDFSLADRAKFLKNEYGIGGRSYDFKNQNQDHGFIDHDSKGLTVCVSSKDSSSLFKDAESKTFLWTDVSLRIEKLIATGNYFTDEEMEHYNSMNKDEILPDWLLKKYDIVLINLFIRWQYCHPFFTQMAADSIAFIVFIFFIWISYFLIHTTVALRRLVNTCQLYFSKSTIRRNCKGDKAVEDTGMNFIMIKWDIDNLCELDCLPSVLYLDDEDEDMVDKLSDAYGYCIKEYRILDKEDVLKCLADEILQNSFNKTFSGNYYTDLSDVQDESIERFHYELNEKDKSNIFDMICQDCYLLDANWDEDDDEEYYDLMLGYGRINNGYEFDDGCDDEEERYNLRQNLLDDLRVKTPLAYDILNCSLTLPDGRIIENVLSKLQADKLYEDFLYNLIDEKYQL